MNTTVVFDIHAVEATGLITHLRNNITLHRAKFLSK
jgi:hypothetical protein